MILEVSDLILHFQTRRGIVKAVDGISFKIDEKRSMALVGESGSGKSSTANAVLRVLPRNVQEYSGKIILGGRDVMKLSDEVFRQEVSWKGISMVFQGAMNSLNPVVRVGEQVIEPLLVHNGVDKGTAMKMAEEAMEGVRLPVGTLGRYAHELSGGMKQRVVIAMALVSEPDVIILDEPTSALDVITQANIVNTLKDLKDQRGLSYVFITHDLALASELADDVAVMYGGKVVEHGTAERVYQDPRHPYTQKLLASVPTLRKDKELGFISGAPPDLVNPPKGCRFRPRCTIATEACENEPCEVEEDGRRVLCWICKEN